MPIIIIFKIIKKWFFKWKSKMFFIEIMVKVFFYKKIKNLRINKFIYIKLDWNILYIYILLLKSTIRHHP